MTFLGVVQRLLKLTEEQQGLVAFRPVALELARSLEAKENPVGSGSCGWPSALELQELMPSFFRASGSERVPIHMQSLANSDPLCGHGLVDQASVPGSSLKKIRNGNRIAFGPPSLGQQVRIGSAAAYVESVAIRREIPTRDGNLHDFANALTWATFPRTKAVIFQALYEDYLEFFGPSADGPERGRGRGRLADRLTNLDEAGVVQSPDGTSEIYLGHALLEHLLDGRTPIILAPCWDLCRSRRGPHEMGTTGGGGVPAAAALGERFQDVTQEMTQEWDRELAEGFRALWNKGELEPQVEPRPVGFGAFESAGSPGQEPVIF